MKSQHITIATGIYPPDIGGPAQYAEMLSDIWTSKGYTVSVVNFGVYKLFPTGVRHFLYFCALLPSCIRSEAIFALDTFSVAFPAVCIGRIFRKKVIVRVGGDFLWEAYLERTREPIFLSEFYLQERKYSHKEQIIFNITSFVFKYATAIVFSTLWQKEITVSAYGIDISKVSIVENVYTKHAQRNIVPKEKVILSPSRDRFLKNKHGLSEGFSVVHKRFFDAVLDTRTSPHNELISRITEAYCVVVPSFSEVSPNIVLDALSFGVPVVVTKDCGIADRLGDTVVWVDPRNPEAIALGIESLMDARVYSEYMNRISKFTFTHTRVDVADEFLSVAHSGRNDESKNDIIKSL